jgi:hypothetical protein
LPMGDTQVCETAIGRAVLHRSRVYTAALEKELGVELERETRRLEQADALMRKTEDGAAAETERQKRIRRGQAAQAARHAALGIARGAREAERQAEHDGQTEQVRLRLLIAQEKQHEQHHLAIESASARRWRRQVESEAQAAARLALTSSAVSASHVSAAARIDELGSTVQTVVAERREQRERRMEEISRRRAGREEYREKQVADIGALGRRAEANVDAARAEAQRRRHAAAEARRARQRAATAMRWEQDAKLEREQRAVDLQGREEDAEWVRRWANRGFDLVSRDLGGRRSNSSAPPAPSPNLTPRPPPDQPTPRVAGIEERAAREREKLLRMDEKLKATEAQVCTHSARTAHAQRTHRHSARTSIPALHPHPPPCRTAQKRLSAGQRAQLGIVEARMRAAFLKTRGSVAAGKSDLPTATAACAALQESAQTLAYVPTTQVLCSRSAPAHACLHICIPDSPAPPQPCTRPAPPSAPAWYILGALVYAGWCAAPITRRDDAHAARRELRPVYAVQPPAHRQFGAACVCPRRRVGARQVGAR